MSTPAATPIATPAPPPGARRLYPGLDQLVLRSVVVLGALGCLVSVQATGAGLEQWEQLVVLALALLTALRPDSLAGLGLTLWVVILWAGSPVPSTVPVLGCAAGLVVVHVAALLAALGPARMGVDGGQALRWSVRGLELWLAAATVWTIGQLLAGARGGEWAQAAGLVVLTLAAGLVTVLLQAGRRAR